MKAIKQQKKEGQVHIAKMSGIDSIFNILELLKFIVVWFWWAFLLIYIIGMKIKWKNWPVEAIIFEKRGSNLIKTNDRAGKHIDKYTGLISYKLQKAKDDIPVVGYDWVLHNVFKPTTFFEKFVHLLRGNIGTIVLFRYGSKQYKPIIIKENGESKTIYQEIKDDNGKSVYIKIYQPIDPRDKLGGLDFEIVDWDNMNFIAQEQRASMERRTKRSDWILKFAMPLAFLAVTLILCIMMIKFGYDFALDIKGSDTTPLKPKAEIPNIPVISDVIPGK